ncbi:MAG: low molecular weight protein-tyrosine-phosphatase [Gammaproteobacteria bacterium]
MIEREKINVLFVCMGNICRSPTAEGVFHHLVRTHGLEDLIGVDSAGTHAYHEGESPDPRACASAKEKNYDISFARARKIVDEDFAKFNYILPMDKANQSFLQVKAPLNHRDKIELFLDYHPDKSGEEVPDPYYRDSDLFEGVFKMVEEGCWNLLKVMRKRHHL